MPGSTAAEPTVAARSRLDAELVRRGLVRSREQAALAIEAGLVKVSGTVATKPSTRVDLAEPLLLLEPETEHFASRGGGKLAPALDHFIAYAPPLQVAGRCLDAGASTGGFTDVLLRLGATHVLAVDVGYGQLAWELRTDERVTVLDRTNARALTPEMVGTPVDLVVADLSFISLRLVLPALRRVAREAADFVVLVKPQFEVGRERVGPGGVVRDAAARVDAVLGVAAAASGEGLGVRGVIASRLPGPAGNVEYFLWLAAGAPPVIPAVVAAAVEAGPR